MWNLSLLGDRTRISFRSAWLRFSTSVWSFQFLIIKATIRIFLYANYTWRKTDKSMYDLNLDFKFVWLVGFSSWSCDDFIDTTPCSTIFIHWKLNCCCVNEERNHLSAAWLQEHLKVIVTVFVNVFHRAGKILWNKEKLCFDFITKIRLQLLCAWVRRTKKHWDTTHKAVSVRWRWNFCFYFETLFDTDRNRWLETLWWQKIHSVNFIELGIFFDAE